jgi:hypothetical protein
VNYPPLKDTLVIGWGHRARHGKDTAAAHLMGQIELPCARVSFADALYSYCRVEHGMTVKDAPLLQRVGVAMRERDPEAWIRAAYYSMTDRPAKVVMIADVRFPNEVEFVKSIGGFVVKVERYMADGSLYIAGDRDPNHISEIALADYSGWDAVIPNYDGEIATFRQSVDMVYELLWDRWMGGKHANSRV